MNLNHLKHDERDDASKFGPLAHRLMTALRRTLARFRSEFDEIDLPAPDSDLQELMEYDCFRHLRHAYQQGEVSGIQKALKHYEQAAALWRRRANNLPDRNRAELWEKRADSYEQIAKEIASLAAPDTEAGESDG